MSKRTEKHQFGEGYTTYHEDGTTSETTKDLFGDGYTTHHSDGSSSRSRRRKTLFGGEVIETTHQDGSKSVTTKDKYGNLRTRHSNGTETFTSKDSFGAGYTTRDAYPSSGIYSDSISSGGAGGELIILGLIAFGIFSVITLFKIESAIVILPILFATIIIRIILTRKFDTGFFFLWFHPATLLCWRLLCKKFLIYSKDNGGAFQLLGMLFVIFFILMGIIEKEESLDEHLLYRIYAFWSFVGSVVCALGDMPFDRTISTMFGIALVATPIWILVRLKKKSSVKSIPITTYRDRIAAKPQKRKKKLRTKTIRIPSDLGKTWINECSAYYPNYSSWPAKWPGTVYSKLFNIWNAQGRPSDRDIATISGQYLVTMSHKFGEVGDRLTVVLSGGTKFSAVIAYSTQDRYSEWLFMGDNKKMNIMEFHLKCSSSAPTSELTKINLTGWKGKKIKKVINHGTCEELKHIQ